jgi:hypothetical protein
VYKDTTANEDVTITPSTVIIGFITLLSDIAFYHGIK